ncbi:hypothetical protein ACLMJK_008999, partial [Lecanora helva]
CMPAFRDVALQQKPALLSVLIAKALESEASFDKFAPATVSMLSVPLKVAIPCDIPSFLEKVFERAKKSQSCKSIRDVYRSLSGLDASYLNDLTFDVLASFQGSLTELLTQLDLDDPIGNLLCLAILAKFASTPCLLALNDAQSSNGSLHNQVNEKFGHARKYFTGKRAQKTLDVAVLKVINSCSSRGAPNLHEALEILTLARKVIEAIEFDDKQTWMSINQVKVQKLHEKIGRAELNRNLQGMKALEFFLVLSNMQQIPAKLKPNFENVFALPSAHNLSPKTLALCIESLQPSITNNIFFGLLRLACETTNPSTGALLRLEGALRTASSMSELIPQLNNVRASILKNLQTNEISDLVRQLGSETVLSPALPQAHGLGICPFSYAETRIRLHQRLVMLILRLGLYRSSSEPGLGTLSNLVEKQAELCSLQVLCPHCTHNKPQTRTLSFFEASNTPQTETVSYNWKDNLARELSQGVDRQQKSVVRIVGEVCRDLESRCNEAERPFQEERKRSQDLQTRLSKCQNRVAELESQLGCQHSELVDVRNESNHLCEQLETSEIRSSKISKQLEQKNQELDECKVDHERKASLARERSRQQELEYMTILTGKEMVLEEQGSKLAAAENHASELEKELLEVKELSNAKQIDVDRLTASESSLIASKEDILRKAQTASEQHETLASDLAFQIAEAKGKLSDLQQEYDQYACRKSAEVESLVQSHKSSVEELRLSTEEERLKAAKTQEEISSHVNQLRKEIKHLCHERDRQAEEIVEARALKTGFMDFLGRMNTQPAQHVRTSNHAPDADAPEHAALRPHLTASSTSSSSNKTPKRVKRDRISSQKRASKTTKSHDGVRSVWGSTTKSPRTPLANVNVGLSSNQTTPSQHVECDKTRQVESAEEQGIKENTAVQGWRCDKESFDEEDLFTSTDQRQLSPIRSRAVDLPRNSFDETTTDF